MDDQQFPAHLCEGTAWGRVAYRWPQNRGGVFPYDLVGAEGGDEMVADRTCW